MSERVTRALLDEAEDFAKRVAYRAFMAGASACYDIPSQKVLDAAFMRFWDQEKANRRAQPADLRAGANEGEGA